MVEPGTRGSPSFTILARGPFPVDRLRVSWQDASPSTPPDRERLVAATWRRAVRRARRRDAVLFNGPLCRLVQWEAHPWDLALHLERTDYRTFVVTNLRRSRGRESLVDVAADPLGVSAVVTTSDGKLLLGVRSHRVAEYRGWIDLVGGNVDPAAHLVDGVPDPVRAVLQEVQEELGVRAEDVERVVCLGLARNTRTGKPELIFATALAASSELFLQTGPTPEHRQMVALPADSEAVRDFLRRARRVTPSAQAGLTLWCDVEGQSVG
ncbi:MAG TPA: NUDIX hydrolase [Chloroflexota bacterium]